VVCAARDLGASRIVAVVGDGAEAIEREVVSHASGAQIAIQSPARGTGDAVSKALPALEGFKGTVLVLFGADPLMTGKPFPP
jgi:bifunctional UDP-N-acetylglucosamine pyrophosphorylase/glucosamine-1-phosphate N-acetyltransferase